MKLPLLQAQSDERPWYADGLNFTCTQCGNCCTGGPGFVWVTDAEVSRAAAFLQMTIEDFTTKYLRKVAGRTSFNEVRRPNGNHDCIFLVERPVPRDKTDGSKKALAPGDEIPLTRRTCSIYSVRPLQCRTWPFWPENLETVEDWDHAARRCPGMGQGRRHFAQEQIHALRDAKDWPNRPPTSKRE